MKVNQQEYWLLMHNSFCFYSCTRMYIHTQAGKLPYIVRVKFMIYCVFRIDKAIKFIPCHGNIGNSKSPAICSLDLEQLKLALL